MEKGIKSQILPTPRFGAKIKDKKVNFGKLLKKTIKRYNKSLNIKNNKSKNEPIVSKGMHKKRSLKLPFVKIHSQEKDNFSNFLQKKFELRNDFDESHTQEFLNEKEIVFEKLILNDKIIEHN